MRVVVIGAGKMGLPLACQFARSGADVVACDVNQVTVDQINEGLCPIDEPGVPELVSALVAGRKLRATTNTAAAVADADAIVVIVPALLTPSRHADLSILRDVSRVIARGMKPGVLVSYETTVPVGSTRNYFRPILEENGLKAGRDFSLVFSPERVKSQLVLKHLLGTPKVVGGFDVDSANKGAEFYSKFLGAPVDNVGSLEAAELVKLAGMLYRDVNIALSNEIARYAEQVGIDLQPVIAAANTDGEANLLTPGIGVGGHCTPVYPYFLIHDGQERGVPLTLAERARAINDGQALHVLNRVEKNEGRLAERAALILGLGFRPQVKEHLFSPAFLLQEELQRKGVQVRLHDPLYSSEEIRGFGFVPAEIEGTWAFDLMVLNTSHDVYSSVDFEQLRDRGLRTVIDGRNLWSAHSVRAAGLEYYGIGIGDYAAQNAPATAVPMVRPSLTGVEAEAAAAVVRSGWVLQGPQVSGFEAEFAEYVGAPYACAVGSGTAALHLALLAVGVQPGDEVITVSHSFIATANAVTYCGAQPVFVDVDVDTLNICPAEVEKAVNPRTRAILCVHQLGMPCDLRSLKAIAVRHGLALIEDAACALGSEVLADDKWQRVGLPHADIACFSFHPRKILTTGDGGMITTANAKWDNYFRLARNHGMDLSAADRETDSQVRFERYPFVGYNYRMTDVQAAIGRGQLRRIPDMIADRRHVMEIYRDELGAMSELSLQSEPTWARSNWQSLYVRLPRDVSQVQVMQGLLNRGIASRRGVMNAHEEAAYAKGGTSPALPNSEIATHTGIVLPLYAGMQPAEVRRVVSALKSAMNECRSVPV